MSSTNSMNWWLIVAAIASLHLLHVPYWFAGIMGYHYVFESLPLWCLLFAGVTQRLFTWWHAQNHQLMSVWWCGLTTMAVIVSLMTVPPLWPARLDRGVAELMFARDKYGQFETFVGRTANGERAIILIQPDPSDRHIDYVTNSPDLNDQMLRARFDAGTMKLTEIAKLFADRDVYLFDAASGQMQRVQQ